MMKICDRHGDALPRSHFKEELAAQLHREKSGDSLQLSATSGSASAAKTTFLKGKPTPRPPASSD